VTLLAQDVLGVEMVQFASEVAGATPEVMKLSSSR
jgi:hypothetical protein